MSNSLSSEIDFPEPNINKVLTDSRKALKNALDYILSTPVNRSSLLREMEVAEEIHRALNQLHQLKL